MPRHGRRLLIDILEQGRELMQEPHHNPRDFLGQSGGSRLGPQPESAVGALADLGLSDEKIGCHFRIGPRAVAVLRRKYGIVQQLADQSRHADYDRYDLIPMVLNTTSGQRGRPL